MVIDSLRSSWREFQALHDLGLNIPLLQEILGSNRTFHMATTPPHSPTGEGYHSHTVTGAATAAAGTTASTAIELYSQQGQQDQEEEDVNPFKLTPNNNNNSSLTLIELAAAAAEAAKLAVIKEQQHASTGGLATLVTKESNNGSSTALNRLETIDSMVSSWKMKGCTDKFVKYLRLKYNPSQLHAIHTAVDQQGFTLVQGPPGTGKTSTILGILNALHIREYNAYYKQALEAILGAEGQLCRAQAYEHPWLRLIATLSRRKPRILVVAPSNTAVDNVILRVMESGFVDGNGGKYYPKILRMGSGSRHPKIKSITLEELCESELSIADNATNRRELLEVLNEQISGMIKDVAFLQSLLINMQVAFNSSHPLPKHFEIRVDAKSGQPYWVDHKLKNTSLTPPGDKMRMSRVIGGVFNNIEALPDYTYYSHKLTQLLTTLDASSVKRNKIHAIDTMKESNSSSTSGGIGSGGGVNVRELTEDAIIEGTHILFTTLNSAGHPSMESTEFCVTLIDEAAQVRWWRGRKRWRVFC